MSREAITETAERVAIFEIYFKHSESVDQFGVFLRDTLKLPVEWEPFDFFGNGLVSDAAYYLGNTTLELLALQAGDTSMKVEARFNRVLFESKNVEENVKFLKAQGLQYTPSFDFNIASDGSELLIGRQINLDSLSHLSKVNIAFWKYYNVGFSFKERSISAKDENALNEKLNNAFESNPLGIVGLKEIHLTINPSAEEQWIKLLGVPNVQSWKLRKGPSISYDLSEQSIGLDRISIQVAELSKAIKFLTYNQVAFSVLDGKMEIDRTEVYGLNITLEE